MNALLERLSGLTLLDPAWLLLAPGAVALPILAAWRGRPSLPFAPAALFRRRTGLLATAADPGEGPAGRGAGRPPRAPRSWRTALRHLPVLLEALALLGLVVALARPVARERVAEAAEGLDLLLCLDTSSSMTARDLDPDRTRLEVARDAAAEFVRGRGGDRIGLVAFARYADVRCPLTRDHAALLGILEGVTTVASDGPEDATAIGAAVARSAEVLEGGGGRAARVVVLLTDGEENVATTGASGEIAPAHAAQLCGALGVKVHAILAGTGRARHGGASVPVDTAPVEALAARTGGAFLAARDAAALEAVYARIDAAERAPVAAPRSVLRDRFLPVLLASLVLLVLGRILGTSVLDVLP